MRILFSRRLQPLAALAAAGLLAACGPADSGPPAAQPPPAVSVAEVIVQPINDWDEFSARLQAPESVELRPRVSGHIDQVMFRDGALVKKGALLFQIDPRPFQAKVSGLEAQLRQAQAIQARASREAERGERLRAGNAISLELADARKTAYQEATSAAAAIRAQLDEARLNLSFTRVTAPIEGRISRAEVTAGNLVSEGSTLLTTLVQTRQLHAYFDIDEATYIKYVRHLRGDLVAARVPVTLALGGKEQPSYDGYLDFIDNQINPRTGTLRARAVVDNTADGLTPGLYARLRLQASSPYSAALVRDEAIATDLGQRYVLVLGEDSVVRYRKVALGPTIEGLRVVREGLGERERIVVNGLQHTRPGATVSPEQTAMASQDTLARLARLVTSDNPLPLAGATQGTRGAANAPES